MGVVQLSTTQVNSFEVNVLKIAVNNTNSTQVDISEFTSSQTGSIQNEIAQINPTEISLPSSIALQQFLSRHGTPPTTIYNLNNTALTLWSAYLLSPTLLNLNIEITDFPKGQLAEA